MWERRRLNYARRNSTYIESKLNSEFSFTYRKNKMSSDSESPQKPEIIEPKKNAIQKRKNENSEDGDIQPETARKVRSFLQMTSGTRSAMSMLFEKFTPQHIDKYLDYIQRDDDKENDRKSSDRWFQMAYIIIGVISFFVLVIYLQSRDKDLLLQLLTVLIAFGGGFGFGKLAKDKES